MTVNRTDIQGEEIQVALSIYTVLVKKYNSVPQLSVETLFLNYYDDIKPYVTPLFDYWLLQEVAVPRNDKEKEALLNSLSGEHQKRLTSVLHLIWYHLGMAFTDLTKLGDSNYVTVLNEARQEVW